MGSDAAVPVRFPAAHQHPAVRHGAQVSKPAAVIAADIADRLRAGRSGSQQQAQSQRQYPFHHWVSVRSLGLHVSVSFPGPFAHRQ